MLKQTPSFSTLTAPSLLEKAPEEQELELPMLEARKRNPSIFSEDDLPSPSSISAERRQRDPVCCPHTDAPDLPKASKSDFHTLGCASSLNVSLCLVIHTDSMICHCSQPEDTRGLFTKVLHFCISNWEKALILGVLITLIVLVSVKVTPKPPHSILLSNKP